MTPQEIERNFTHHTPMDVETVRAHERVRSECKFLASVFSERLVVSRETSVALGKIEEAMFWANASIARNGLPL